MLGRVGVLSHIFRAYSQLAELGAGMPPKIIIAHATYRVGIATKLAAVTGKIRRGASEASPIGEHVPEDLSDPHDFGSLVLNVLRAELGGSGCLCHDRFPHTLSQLIPMGS